MAAGLGPAWPQLSPWQPGTGKQRVFAFRWHQGACKSLQMSFVSGLCKQEGAGHGFGAAQLCVCGLDLGRGCPLVSRPGQGCWTAKRLLMLSLPYSPPASPALPEIQFRLSSSLFCSWNPSSSSRLKVDFIPDSTSCLSFPFHKSRLIPFQVL